MKMTNDRPGKDFDLEVKKIIEANFPLEVVVDETNKTGYFRVTSAFSPFAGTVFRFQNASYDDVSNHLSFAYEILSNPKNVDQNSPGLRDLMFKTLQVIFQFESQWILKNSEQIKTSV